MKAVVLGYSISGKDAAKLLVKKGYSVIAVDRDSSKFEENQKDISFCKEEAFYDLKM